jgi:hypothetical protein
VRVMGGKERRVRSAVAHRHSEPLAVSHGDVSPPFARRGEYGQAQEVSGSGDECARGVGPVA